MNKPAAREPSMDEILSSIRQIIADDDAAGVPRRPVLQAAPEPMEATQAQPLSDAASDDSDFEAMLGEVEPLALSTSQIVKPDEAEEAESFSFESLLADTETEVLGAPELVEADDINFDESDSDTEEELPSFDPALAEEPEPQPEPMLRVVAPAVAPQAPVSAVAPLPDPTLTSEIAEDLLGAATKAAVRSSIGKLSNMGIGTPGLTLEAMMREMLRPMLKDWLDEHLPSVVERMVEKEIGRISRGE